MKILFDEFFGCLHSFLVFFSFGLDDHLVFDLVFDCDLVLLSLFHDVGKDVLFAAS